MPGICNKLNASTRVPVFISVKEISNPQRVSEFATPQKQSQIFYYCNETTLFYSGLIFWEKNVRLENCYNTFCWCNCTLFCSGIITQWFLSLQHNYVGFFPTNCFYMVMIFLTYQQIFIRMHTHLRKVIGHLSLINQ